MSDSQEERETFAQRLESAVRLKNFAIDNGYAVADETLEKLNVLTGAKEKPPDWTRLDQAIRELTAVTSPVTIDSLSQGEESPAYYRFKRLLVSIGVLGLVLAIGSFAASTMNFYPQYGNSILALSLGLLGAVVYSLFNVLRIVPPRAFNPMDEYSNYARLLLGVLLGWIFYFAFSRVAYSNLPDLWKVATDGSSDSENTTNTLLLLVPFVAGYSTKFVVGALERVIYAFEVSLGIDEKRGGRGSKR